MYEMNFSKKFEPLSPTRYYPKFSDEQLLEIKIQSPSRYLQQNTINSAMKICSKIY